MDVVSAKVAAMILAETVSRDAVADLRAASFICLWINSLGAMCSCGIGWPARGRLSGLIFTA
jgi:hypothetical protein